MIIKNKQNSVSLIFHTLGAIFKENDKRKMKEKTFSH